MDELDIKLSDVLGVSDYELENNLGICNVDIYKHKEIFLDIHRVIERNNGISIEDFDNRMKIIFQNNIQMKKPNFLHGSYCKSDENAGKMLQVERLEGESAESLYIEGTHEIKRFGYANRSDLVYMICGYELLQETETKCIQEGFSTMEYPFEYIDFDTTEIKEKQFKVPFYEKNGRQPIVFLPTQYCTPGDIGHHNKETLLKLLDEDVRAEIISNNNFDNSAEFLIQISDDKSAKQIKDDFKNLKLYNNALYNYIDSVIIKSDTYNEMLDQALKKKLERDVSN
jgi:hypothetical protein